MSPVVLVSMTSAQEQGWRTLLDLYADFPAGWCLVGGQMVWLYAREHNVEPVRLTEDIDIVVDLRADQQAIRRLCGWLEARCFELEGINADGIGHRYVALDYLGPGRVTFDLLAPENLGRRADLTTTPPARTVSAPGTRAALDATECVEIVLGERSGHVLRPSLLAAILAKAAATTIPTRTDSERDWVDAAFLLSLVDDPAAAAAELSSAHRRKLQAIDALLDDAHPAWRSLGARARIGHVTLQFLLSA